MNICFCHTCKKEFKSLGIAQHRAAHKARKQDCTITFSNGKTFSWNYSKAMIAAHRTQQGD